MRIGTFALLSAAGMAATSLAVWRTTGSPARGGEAARADQPGADTLAPPADRSHFEVGNTLLMEGRLGHPVLPAQSDTETFLFVDVSADAARHALVAAPIELAIAIDRSGSMSGQRLTNALAAARTAVARLHDGDIVSVIVYNTRTELLVAPTRIDAASRSRIAAGIGGIRATGDTCISCAIEASMRVLSRDDRRVSRILLLSDGEATAGVRDVDGFRRLAESSRGMGASITTIGVDLDYNERIMAALARDSNGGHFFVQDPTELPAVFDQEMASLASTVATGAELTVDLAPGVFVDQVFDRAFSRAGNRVVVPLGSFAGADKKTLLLRLRVPSGPAGERPLAAVRLAYEDLAGGGAGHCEGELAALVSADPGQVSPLDGIVSARVSSSETAATLEEANQLLEGGKIAEAHALIGTRRAALHAAKAPASALAPMARRTEVDSSFAHQDALLSQATSGFAAPPEEVAEQQPMAEPTTGASARFATGETMSGAAGVVPTATTTATPPPSPPPPTQVAGPPAAAPRSVATKPAPPPKKGAAQIKANQASAVRLEN